MGYYQNQESLAITKHYLMAYVSVAKFVFFLLLSCLFYYIGIQFWEELGNEFVTYIIFPLSFFFLNYGFLKLMLGWIEYYNYLFIIKDDQIFVINCSLILKDDIEIIDSFKIIKVDSFGRGLMANIFHYGTVVIELQSREVRSFRFMPDPFRLVRELQKQRDMILSERAKRYISVDESLTSLTK